MAGLGPPPKPAEQRRRRNAPMANTLRLPAEGRAEAAPLWPLSGDIPDVWADLWATPQSVAWERLGWTRVVARYALLLGEAEAPKCSAAVLSEVRQLEDRLGLTPMSLLRLRWEITEDELGDRRPKPAAGKRRRLIVVDDAVAT